MLIGLRGYPPKQALVAVTGLDRGDFTTHQARSILRRLEFGVYRKGDAPRAHDDGKARWPKPGRHAAALAPNRGRYVAQERLGVLYESDSPYDVVRWLRENGLRATVLRVPATAGDVGSMITEG